MISYSSYGARQASPSVTVARPVEADKGRERPIKADEPSPTVQKALALRDEREARALAYLTEAADRGDPCPTALQILQHLGVPPHPKTAHEVVTGLIARDLISIEAHGPARVVTILATGKRTAPTQPKRRAA